jgi:hypothetical protein
MKGDLVGSSPSLEGAKKMMGDYLYSRELRFVEADGYFEVHNSRGRTSFIIRPQGKRWRIEGVDWK